MPVLKLSRRTVYKAMLHDTSFFLSQDQNYLKIYKICDPKEQYRTKTVNNTT